MPLKDSIRKFAVRVAVDIALNGAILVTLIFIRSSVLNQLAGQLFNSVEPQLLVTSLPPDIGSPQCPESGSRSSSSLQTRTVIVGSFVYALIFVGIFTSRDEMKQVQAFLGTIIKGGLFLASEVVREYARRSLCMAAYSVKNLRTRLEAIPRYLEFPACLGAATILFFSKINQLKMDIFFFGLGIVVTMVYHHFQSLSTYAHLASGGLSLLAYDLTDLAETFSVTITKSNSVLATVLFSLGLRFLFRSILSFSTLISTRKGAQKLGLNAALLVSDEEKQDVTILFDDISFAQSDKDTLCDDDEDFNLNAGDDEDDESEKNINSPGSLGRGQEAVSIPTTIANGQDKGDCLKQRREVPIISNPAEDIPSLGASPDRSILLRQQQANKLNSWSQRTSPLSAFTPEFVPRFRNTAPLYNPVQDYYPPHWAVASPVSVRITAPVKRHRIRRSACLHHNEENGGV